MAQRKVYFYRSYAGWEEDGSHKQFDPRNAINEIVKLDFVPDGRYMDDGHGQCYCIWVDDDRRRRYVVGRIRRSDLPLEELGGQVQPLSIHDDAGVIEQAHVTFFDNNVVGLLYNHFGPRMSALGTYLKSKSTLVPRILRFDQLLRNDVLEQLDRMQSLTMVTLKVDSGYARRLGNIDGLLTRGLVETSTRFEADVIEVALRSKPRSPMALTKEIVNTVKHFAMRADLREGVRTLKVAGRSTGGGLQQLDLLKDQLIVSTDVEVAVGRNRQLDSNSAFSAIDSAYNIHKAELVLAASGQS